MFDLFSGVTASTQDQPDGTRLALIGATGADSIGDVLFLHGFTGGKEDFLFTLVELPSRRYDAYAVDLRGTGSSSSPGPFDLDTMAEDVVTLARRLAERSGHPLHLVGHSYGGLVAERAVAAHPTGFASLTLLCSGPAGFLHSAALNPVTVDRARMFADVLATNTTLAQAWDQKSAYENVDVPAMLENFLRERFISSDRAAVVQMLADVLHAPDAIDPVVATGVPVFVAFGEHDGTWAQSVQRQMASRLGTDAIVIPESTHLPVLENVDAAVAAIADALDTVHVGHR